ncbi:MAG: hypothetical protein R3B91_06160 [Planctomycetaceae bacterium]
MAFLDELRHAFAVEPIGAVEPTDAQRKLIDQLCREIARRRLTAPAILSRKTASTRFRDGPGNSLFSIISVFTDRQGYREFAEFLEHRGAIDYLLARLSA